MCHFCELTICDSDDPAWRQRRSPAAVQHDDAEDSSQYCLLRVLHRGCSRRPVLDAYSARPSSLIQQHGLLNSNSILMLGAEVHRRCTVSKVNNAKIGSVL